MFRFGNKTVDWGFVCFVLVVSTVIGIWLWWTMQIIIETDWRVFIVDVGKWIADVVKEIKETP